MEDRLSPSLADSISAAMDWWRDAGVDCSFEDEPQAWLADPVESERAEAPSAPNRPKPKPEAAPVPKIGGDGGNWPQDLAAFRNWWLEEPSLDLRAATPRIAMRGPADAPLMILVPMPEAEDTEILFSGPQGMLMNSMVQAMGFAPDAVCLAAALPRHMPVPDWAGLSDAGLGEILRHLVALARPERLLVLGRSIPPLFGHNPAQDSPQGFQIPIDSGPVPAMVGYAPERLLQQPRLRAGLWRRWLEWTDHGSQ
ncbi:Uracil DNA glycosylase superfamily protein [Croceibacterium atlanticum]|uniref:Uracil DNA glycosylase superfamily protein n=2 Tax=Croceibacterium atlanticum TaxID=1267766 RepID=A0A0F7KRA4_9SPHN|nr:hypothetical protein [Croceibacterium atlanticum]AKH41732.1 Uracil DNA glycosylase superfamily protein [Croceibacterium atlanticum]